MTWIKKHLALLVLIGAMLDSLVFGVQGFQVSQLQSQQRQLQVQSQALHIQAVKSKCWDTVLDKVVKRPAGDTESKAQLIADAERCAKADATANTSGRGEGH